jgi:hypothetical protein
MQILCRLGSPALMNQCLHGSPDGPAALAGPCVPGNPIQWVMNGTVFVVVCLVSCMTSSWLKAKIDPKSRRPEFDQRIQKARLWGYSYGYAAGYTTVEVLLFLIVASVCCKDLWSSAKPGGVYAAAVIKKKRFWPKYCEMPWMTT